MSNQLVIFSDLDGTLLDHFDYSYTAAEATLQRLDNAGIPLILVTSKTCAELLELRRKLGNRHPFVAENGAAIYLPCNYFPQPPANIEKIEITDSTYWLHRVGQPRRYWLELLRRTTATYGGCYRAFSELGAEGIAEQTGLSVAQARLADQRASTEPIQWLGSDTQLAAFTTMLGQHGGHAVAGGRFLHIMDKCISKGYALRWLVTEYQRQRNCEVLSIALGDSDNDLAMLREASEPVIIRSPAHGLPDCSGLRNPRISQATGPEGWSESLEKILDQHGVAKVGATG